MEESGVTGRWLPEEGFTLSDPEFETIFNFNLASRMNRDKLFSRKVFYITPSVKPSMAMLQNIIQFAGGRIENRCRKTPEQMREMNHGGNINYIIITCQEDVHLVTDILKAKLGVFNPNLIFNAVLRVEMDFNLSMYMTTL